MKCHYAVRPQLFFPAKSISANDAIIIGRNYFGISKNNFMKCHYAVRPQLFFPAKSISANDAVIIGCNYLPLYGLALRYTFAMYLLRMFSLFAVALMHLQNVLYASYISVVRMNGACG